MTSYFKNPIRIGRTFRVKILLGYGGALLAIIIIFSWTVVNLLSLGRASDAILRENYKSILAAEKMIDAVERQDSAILMSLLGIGESARKEFRENENQFLQWLGRALDNITIVGEAEILDSIESHYTDYLLAASPLLQGGETSGLDAYRETIQGLFSVVRNGCIRLREINEATMFAASRRTQALSARAVRWTIMMGGAAVVIGLWISFFLSSRLARPVEQMRKAAVKIAEGDYEVQVPVHGADELADLARQFNRMSESLKQYHDLNIGRILAEKRKSEAILRSVDDGIVVVDGEHRIININPMAGNIFGIDPKDAVKSHFLEAVRDDRLFDLIKTCVKSGRPSSPPAGEDMIAIRRGESEAYYQFSIVPIRAEPGIMQGVVLLLRDVTRLRELDRLKSEFVMTASHELRTPLTSIGLGIDLIMEQAADRLNERELEMVAAAHEDVERLKALLNELLDLSKIEAGELPMNLERVPAGILCDKAYTIMRPQAEEASVALETKFQEDLPEVKADPNKVTWVLVNLIGNALRYTQEGGHIRVLARRAGDQVHLSVNDDGEGIAEQYQSKIFDKFVQVQSRNSGGSGLGLAICKEIVRAHGGTIWVESAVGKGSTFTFTLPVAA